MRIAGAQGQIRERLGQKPHAPIEPVTASCAREGPHERGRDGGEDHRHEEIDDEVPEAIECAHTTGEPADADSGDEDFDESRE